MQIVSIARGDLISEIIFFMLLRKITLYFPSSEEMYLYARLKILFCISTAILIYTVNGEI